MAFIFNLILVFIFLQASLVEFVQLESIRITDVTNGGPIRTTRRPIWVPVGSQIPSVELHMPRESSWKRCKWNFVQVFTFFTGTRVPENRYVAQYSSVALFISKFKSQEYTVSCVGYETPAAIWDF